ICCCGRRPGKLNVRKYQASPSWSSYFPMFHVCGTRTSSVAGGISFCQCCDSPSALASIRKRHSPFKVVFSVAKERETWSEHAASRHSKSRGRKDLREEKANVASGKYARFRECKRYHNSD